jgi:lysophospholipase L1-like esterase
MGAKGTLEEREDMKIVALGDSLTVGAQSQSDSVNYNEHTSYPAYLEVLGQQYSDKHQLGIKVNVVNKGISGDLTSGMLQRFARDVIAENADCVIILGGTNDIGWNLDPTMIARNLGRMYEIAQNEDIVPVACSIPSILGFDHLISPRLLLNRMILTQAQRRNITLVDLFAATADPETNRLLAQYSADGLHLNDEGYKHLGLRVFNQWLKTFLLKYKK